MSRRLLATLSASTLALGLAAAAPAAHAATGKARTTKIRSFDGVSIVTHFFPAGGSADGRRAPTVLLGHGWGGRGETDTAKGMLGALLSAGYNVVTWNARGFGSGGEANVDYHAFEGRDVRALIDWTARQPEVQLDRSGDPRLGMAGGSYGGAIQLVTAGIDRRVDVIVPLVAYNDLRRTLYRDRVLRAGWVVNLCLGGMINGNRVAPKVRRACFDGVRTGRLEPDLERWFADHGPSNLIGRLRIPTLVVQGTVDTLFPLREGIATYRTVKANGGPAKMIWFCGGHGQCNAKAGPADHVTRATLAWFARHLRGDRSVDTGPEFEYIDQNGVYRGAAAYPPPALGPLRARGTGRMTFTQLDNTGSATAAAPARRNKAIEVPIPASPTTARVVGSPRVTLTYRGHALRPGTALFAQIVDRETGVVVGNQATPLPVTLDGRERTVTRDLEAIAWEVGPASRLTLQIIPGTGLFTWQRSAGRVEATVSVDVPRVR
ncbi:alpha/beta fold hydrolase [Actinomadura kijaniata]|uniref:alpha/beta fold hydrolase n=1 Tax=Actinomadura kijaniata TaxID=46161 RepID=UPI00082AD83F|nr:alpha/beta fold hydrolase [Actinomadura kijaniata]